MNNLSFPAFIFRFLHITLLLVSVSVLIYGIYLSRELFLWRVQNLSVPMFFKLHEDKYFFSEMKFQCIDIYIYNGIMCTYRLQEDYTIIFIIMLVLFLATYLYKYFTNKSLILVRICGLLILGLIFLFYYDSFFAHIIELLDKYFILKGWPSFNTIFPFYESFLNSEVLKHSRVWVGYGLAYENTSNFPTMTFRYDITKLDPHNYLGFNNLPKELYAQKLRILVNKDIFPSLIETYHCMHDLNYYKQKYNITKGYNLYFLHSPMEFWEYSFGLSLACIIFLIAIILSVLYLLNFLTSLSYKDSEKLSSYECGFDPIHTNARIKFDVLYWIIGILYLIFDLEIIFIFPLATILQTIQSPIALLAYLFFMIVLTLGFIYEWKKGALKLKT